MSHLLDSSPTLDLRPADRARALAWLLALTALIFLVAFDQGAVSAGQPVAHELFHDARHLLGVPCH